MDSPGVQVTWTVRKKFSLFSFLNFLMASIYLFMQRNSQLWCRGTTSKDRKQQSVYWSWPILVDCQHFADSWGQDFFGLLHYNTGQFITIQDNSLQYRTIHYFVKCLRGLKFVGRVHPQNPRTSMPHEQCWFHSTIKEMKTYCIPTLFISWQKEN